jgi:hypothetical protein
MDTTEFKNVVSSAINFYKLSLEQQNNIKHIANVSKKFHNDAGISSTPSPEISADTIIVESGHQPNFIPYAGIWKKAFLLHYISSLITKAGKQSFVFYGFADQNLSTASLLFKNQIPALNKTGSEKIGLKKVDDINTKWKCFNQIEKPPLDIWHQEIKKIENYYWSNLDKLAGGPFSTKEEFQIYLELLWKSYESATTLSDLNAFFFAKVCDEILQFDILFFRYSDVQKHKLFKEEWIKIFNNLNSYNAIYNRAVADSHLDLNQVSMDTIPCWYHCNCGGKLPLKTTELFSLTGICPLCQKEYHLSCNPQFSDIHKHLENLGFNAVTRNMILSNGIGTSIFISGSGGSLKYSIISDLISHELNFHIPLTMSWVSKDYYLGLVHKNGLQDLMKTYKITLDDIIYLETNDKINNHLSELKKNLDIVKNEKTDKKLLKIQMNAYNNFVNVALNVKTSFSIIPSMIDMFAGMGPSQIVQTWCDAIEDCTIEKKPPNLVKMVKNVCYEDKGSGIKSDDIKKIYDGIAGVKVP